MNAATGTLPPVTTDGSASCASAIRLPNGDSSESSGVRTTDGVVMWPITLFAIGSTSFLYFAISSAVLRSCTTSWVTIWLFASVFTRSTSPVALSMLSRTSVTSRPNDDALVTSRGLPALSGSEQLWAWWVWPEMIASISGSRPALMSTIGPEMPGQLLYAFGSAGKPPSCSSTTIDFTPLLLSTGTSAFAVSTSSLKVSPATPDLVTMFGVFSSVMAMNATFCPPSKDLIVYGANSVFCVFSKNTFAERYLNLAPLNGCFGSGQEFWLFCPSPSGRQPPDCIRSNSCQPSSNSWLPTDAASSPIPFSASIVGSSWNAADNSGEAPIRSPAATVTESCPFASAAARRSFRWVARYAAPPAGMPLMLPLEPVAGSRLPWKSLIASSWIWVCVGFGFAACTALACVAVPDCVAPAA